MIRVRGPDGSSFTFPEGTDQATIERALGEHYGQAQKPSQAEAFGRGAMNWSGWADNATEALLGQVAKLDPEYAQEVASRTLGPQARGMTPAQLARARVDQAIREPQALAAEARPWSMAAGQIAGALPAAIATGGVGTARAGTPILQRMAYNAAQAMPAGAAWGAIQGSGNADAPGQNRLLEGGKGAAIGAGLAGVGGAVLPEVINAGASAVKLGAGIANRFNLTPDQRAVRMIQKRVDPRSLAGTDGPEQIVDVGGKRLVGLGDAVAQMDETPGAEIMSAARTGQRGDVQDFMLARGAGATGKNEADYVSNLDALREQRRANAKPLYAQAWQTPLRGWEDFGELAPILQRVPSSVMARADELAALEGVPQPTPFQRLDYVSRAISSAAESEAPRDAAGRVIATQRGGALLNLKAELDNALLSMADERNSGALRAARQAYAGPSAQMEAQKLGRSIVQARNFDPEDLATRLTRMSDDEQDAFILGVARSISDQTEAGQMARFASNLRNNRRLQQRLLTVLGQERFNALVSVTERAGKMLANTDRMLRNSATAGRIENIRNATDGEAEGAQLAVDVLSGNVRSAVARRAGQWWLRNRMPGIRDPRVSEAVASRLTQRATPENIRALVDEMAGLDRLRGAAMQPVAIPQSARTYGVVGNAQPPRPRGLFGSRRP